MVQYVDDSTSLIGCYTIGELELYLNSYHSLLEKFYHENKLCLNSEKTKLLMTKTPENNQNRTRVSFMTSNNKMTQEDWSIKILGFHKNGRDSYNTHLNSVKGRVVKALMDISHLLKHMDLKTQKEVVYAKAGSIALYGAELFTGQNEWTQNRHTAILMRCNRSIHCKDWFRVSNKRI